MDASTPTKEIVTRLINWIESTADFAREQWPDFIDQFMRAAVIKTWLNIIGSFVLVVALIAVGIYCSDKCKQYDKSCEIPMIISFGAFMPFLIALTFSANIFLEIHNLIDLYIAPKVYIIKHIKELLK